MANPDKIMAMAFAFAGAEQQADLLNMIGRELHVACKGKSEMQYAWISDALNSDGRHFIKELAEFIKLREEKLEG